MTETSAPAAREITEFVVCPDCAIVIANGDSSGIEDADAHLDAMSRELAGVRNVVIVDKADTGFRTDTCGACGTYTGTDDWYDATAEIA
jgi:hypothetical protein